MSPLSLVLFAPLLFLSIATPAAEKRAAASPRVAATLEAVVNAASFLGGPVAPGEIVTLFGSGLGPPEIVSMTIGADGRVSTSLAGVQVLFDGRPAPLVYVLAGQVSAVAPYSSAGKTSVSVELVRDGEKASALVVPVTRSAPGIFALDATGSGQGAIVNLDGSINGPSNPIQAGSYVSVYMTGEGQTDPPGEDGRIATGASPRPVLPVKASVGGIDAEVQYAGAAPGYLAGLMQVNVKVPVNVTPGPAVPLVITVGEAASQPGITMAVAPPATSAAAYYQFAIDLDKLGGAPDFSFLNHPLGPADRLFVRDGCFFRAGADLEPDTADDERVRLFGVNLAFGGNFPAEADASRIAKRLRRLGVNLVRLHHMDSWPDQRPEDANSLLTTGPFPTLNQLTVRRMRAFLDALKAEGIYANLNLHVGYEFRPSIDQVPAWSSSRLMPEQSKPMHIFWPRMVDLQADYTRKVIDALKLRDDPVLGMIEINNESSLAFAWQTPWGTTLDDALRGEYRAEFQRQWNAFLRGNYANTEALAGAWGRGESRGPNILPGAWTLEVHSPSQATLEVITQNGIPTARVRVSRGGHWVFPKQVGFSLVPGEVYAAELEIRADLPAGVSRNADFTVMEDTSPWRWINGRSITVTNQWQKYRMVVRPTFAVNGTGRFMLNVQDFIGVPVYIRNCTLQTTTGAGLAAGESLDAGNISVVPATEFATEARTNDYLDFLVETDRAYLSRMLAAAREATSKNVPVTGTQMGFGGLVNFDSHFDLDYIDEHFYLDHYDFPYQAWDARDWRMRDSSSVCDGASWYLNVAASRLAGRPYTVSEFNQPWPNTHAAEIDPLTAALGAFQDWDSIMHFAFAHSRNWDSGVPGGFNLIFDMTKLPVAGLSAWLFRTSAVEAGREPVVIPVSRSTRLAAAKTRQLWNVHGLLKEMLG